jgi:predicted Fe-S protein YdhL (DUF1289 family)
MNFENAACMDADPDLFFSDHKVDREAAKGICHGCAARSECLEWVMSQPQRQAGVWAGLDEVDRERLRKRRTPSYQAKLQGGRPPDWVIEERRRKVWQLRAGNVAVVDIARELSVSPAVVTADLARYRGAA